MNKVQVLGASIVTFILAAFAYAASVLGYFDTSWLEVLAGFLGFGSLAGLRSYFDVAGWKTYGVIGMAAVGIIGLLSGVATPDQVGSWLAFWGIIGGSTLTHAVYKLFKKNQGV